jgi:hypothetical protein
MNNEIIIYSLENGEVDIEITLQDETMWLNLNQIAELFNKDKSVISRHISNIFAENELSENSTVAYFAIVQNEGKRKITRNVKYYNLDVIISVGYRVKSVIATKFRIWATNKLKEYIIKGFVIDDKRLKNPTIKDSSIPDYFDELLEKIRDIRASERRMYLRVKEIFSMAVDYNISWNDTTSFFKIIQNKLHYAVTGMTAAEIINKRADADRKNMGLTSWNKGDIRKTDVIIAKNYLLENEINELNRIVTMWLDYAEDQAKRKKKIFLKDWEEKLIQFLEFNERDVLTNSGLISKEKAEKKAITEFEKFSIKRREIKERDGQKDYINELNKLLDKK